MNKTSKLLNSGRLIGSLALCAAAALLPATTSRAVTLPDLSAFQNYAITVIGGNSQLSWNSGPVCGNVLVGGSGAKVQLSGGGNGGLCNNSSQFLYTDGSANISGSLQTQPTIKPFPGPGTIGSLVTAAQAASAAAAALPATMTFQDVQNSLTITGNSASGGSGLNVISLHNLQNCALTLVGTPADTFIFNVTGGVQSNRPIVLSSGVSASHVLFNLIGNGNVLQTSGGVALVGTYLAANGGQFQFSSLNLTGQLINASANNGQVQFQSNSQLQSFVPFASSGGSSNNAPTVTAPTSAGVTSSGATLGGTVTNLGTPVATTAGVIYSTNSNPTVGGTQVPIAGAPTAGTPFTVPVGGLSPNTPYYYAAYATNTVGTSYSSASSFTTPAAPICPNYVTYNLAWSGNTSYLQCLQNAAKSPTNPNGYDSCGRPYVSNATATGTITLDLCKIANLGGGYGTSDFVSAPGSLCADGIVSYSITVSGAGSGNGTWTYSTTGPSNFNDFNFDFGGPYSGLDFTKNLVGQPVLGGKWEDPNQSCTVPLNGEFVVDGNYGTQAPSKQSLKGIIVTDSTGSCGPNYNYLQLTSFTPAPYCSSAQAAGLNLSSLANYAIVDLGNGTTLGWNSGPVNGSVLVGNGVKVQLSGGNNGGFSSPGSQALYYDSTAMISGNLQNNITETQVPTSLTSAALTTAQNVSRYAALLPPTQTFGNITSPTTIVGNGGLNVINVGNIQNAPLTFQGGPTDVFVINVSGTYQTNVAQVLSGVTASQLLFNFTGTSGNVFQTSGGDRSYGTFLATNGGQFNFSNLNLTGQLINTAGNVQFVSGSQIQMPGPFSGCPATTGTSCP